MITTLQPDIILFILGVTALLSGISIQLKDKSLKKRKLSQFLVFGGLSLILLSIPFFLIRAAMSVNIA